MTEARSLSRPLAGALIALVAATAGFAESQVLVTYRAADVVYLDVGRDQGLELGARFYSAGADLEVTHLAGKTAACRILEEELPVRAGDPVTRRLAGPASLLGRFDWSAATASLGAYGEPDVLEPYLPGALAVPSTISRVRLDGSITFDWEVFEGAGDSSDFERRVTRLNLRARGLGGDAHQVRIRMSGQSYGSSDRDRIYEAAFIRRQQNGPVNFSLGRLAGGSRIGYGPLDGSLIEIAPHPGLVMGGFYGSASELEGLAFDSANRRFGLFAEYLSPAAAAGLRTDLRMSGIREEVSGVASRDYLSFESRLAAGDGRWTLHQRAELDLNTGWRYDLSGRHVQLSNLSLGMARRFGEDRRLSITYDRFQLYRTEETRRLPGELFDDRARHALRASFSLGRLRGWRMSLGAGVRSREGDPDRSYSLTARARAIELTPWRLGLSANLMVFSNPASDGYATHLRATRAFTNRRRLYFDLGRRQWRLHLENQGRSSHWLRLGGDLDLGRSLSIRSEYEISSGDALAGSRLQVGLRYRIRSHP